ncbi:MAG: hypothetical protein NVSMB70_02880 [Chamaesiphon sp.]
MLTSSEIGRLRQAIIATVAAPVIGSIEDYSWEAIFHYIKEIPLSDPAEGRSKLLHDAVDSKTKIGWSLKTLQLRKLTPGTAFQFIIQRADIIDKAEALGFSRLTLDSPVAELGAAIIKHWNENISTARSSQGVATSYEGILLKTRKGLSYVYAQYPLNPLNSSEFSWAWSITRTGQVGKGLQGRVNNKLVLIWYKNQKQLFKVQTIPPNPVGITSDRNRLTPAEYVSHILSALQQKFGPISTEENGALEDDSLTGNLPENDTSLEGDLPEEDTPPEEYIQLSF